MKIKHNAHYCSRRKKITIAELVTLHNDDFEQFDEELFLMSKQERSMPHGR